MELTHNASSLKNNRAQQEHLLISSHQQRTLPKERELNETQVMLRQLREQLRAIKEASDICPTCGQRLPDAHKPPTEALEAEIISHEVRLCELRDAITKLQQEHQETLQKELSSFDDQISVLESRLTSIQAQGSGAFAAYQVSTQQKQQSSVKVAQLQAQLESYQSSQQAIQQGISTLSSELQ